MKKQPACSQQLRGCFSKAKGRDTREKQTNITKHWSVKDRDEQGQHTDTLRACSSQQAIQPAQAGVSWRATTTEVKDAVDAWRLFLWLLFTIG